MKKINPFDKIDLHLIKVLHMVLTERSVSRTALKMGMHQPGVSAALRQWRELMGDALLVRAGSEMVLTEMGQSMIESTAQVLMLASKMVDKPSGFDPRVAQQVFRIGASDFLDPLFLPKLVCEIQQLVPLCRVEISSLSEHMNYEESLGRGELDVVIGNWNSPAEGLHKAVLFEDEVVCMVGRHHPFLRRSFTVEDWLQAAHVAPTFTHIGGMGVIDEHLHQCGLSRNIVVRSQNFSLMPAMVASSLLVLTTGRHYCERYLQGVSGQLPLSMIQPPLQFPTMTYYQLWHERSHWGHAGNWLRSLVKTVAQRLRAEQSQPLVIH
jgi:DNA-binding transcriptional LysR family regulator